MPSAAGKGSPYDTLSCPVCKANGGSAGLHRSGLRRHGKWPVSLHLCLPACPAGRPAAHGLTCPRLVPCQSPAACLSCRGNSKEVLPSEGKRETASSGFSLGLVAYHFCAETSFFQETGRRPNGWDRRTRVFDDKGVRLEGREGGVSSEQEGIESGRRH
jgi:hypothetical protein